MVHRNNGAAKMPDLTAQRASRMQDYLLDDALGLFPPMAGDEAFAVEWARMCLATVAMLGPRRPRKTKRLLELIAKAEIDAAGDAHGG